VLPGRGGLIDDGFGRNRKVANPKRVGSLGRGKPSFLSGDTPEGGCFGHCEAERRSPWGEGFRREIYGGEREDPGGEEIQEGIGAPVGLNRQREPTDSLEGARPWRRGASFTVWSVFRHGWYGGRCQERHEGNGRGDTERLSGEGKPLEEGNPTGA